MPENEPTLRSISSTPVALDRIDPFISWLDGANGHLNQDLVYLVLCKLLFLRFYDGLFWGYFLFCTVFVI